MLQEIDLGTSCRGIYFDKEWFDEASHEKHIWNWAWPNKSNQSSGRKIEG